MLPFYNVFNHIQTIAPYFIYRLRHYSISSLCWVKIVTIRSFLLFLSGRCSISIKKKYRRGTNIKIFYWKKNFLFTSFFKYWFIHFFIEFTCRILFTITCFHPFLLDSDHPLLNTKNLRNVLLHCLFNHLLQNWLTLFSIVTLASDRSISKDDWFCIHAEGKKFRWVKWCGNLFPILPWRGGSFEDTNYLFRLLLILSFFWSIK